MEASEHFALSGVECVLGLCALGFVVVHRHAGKTLLRRDGQIVFVPDHLLLPVSILDRILEQAEVTASALFEALDEQPTEPALVVYDS